MIDVEARPNCTDPTAAWFAGKFEASTAVVAVIPVKSELVATDIVVLDEMKMVVPEIGAICTFFAKAM